MGIRDTSVLFCIIYIYIYIYIICRYALDISPATVYCIHIHIHPLGFISSPVPPDVDINVILYSFFFARYITNYIYPLAFTSFDGLSIFVWMCIPKNHGVV